jgi:hypothetical protein
VPDATYPGIWRIRLPDCSLSDMVNLSRAPISLGGNLIIIGRAAASFRSKSGERNPYAVAFQQS